MGEVPERLRFAVELLDPRPADRVLEIGCGTGVAAGMVAEALVDGRITAVDRSATAIGRARARNARHVAAGRLELVHADLAGLTGGPFDAAFAVNVNVFWTAPATAECAALRALLAPGGRVHLVYDRDRAEPVAATLRREGFTPRIVRGPAGLVAVSATPPA